MNKVLAFAVLACLSGCTRDSGSSGGGCDDDTLMALPAVGYAISVAGTVDDGTGVTDLTPFDFDCVIRRSPSGRVVDYCGFLGEVTADAIVLDQVFSFDGFASSEVTGVADAEGAEIHFVAEYPDWDISVTYDYVLTVLGEL
jgi:hypothetical protein